jgi:hypothetical protein
MEDGTKTPEQLAAEEAAKKTPQFSTEQQDFINKIINDRFGKVSSKHEAEKSALEAKVNELTTKLTEATKVVDPDLDGKGKNDKDKEQFKQLLDTEKTKAKNAELNAANAVADAKKAQEEVLRVRKEVAISRSATKQNFHELEVVSKMIWDNIEWNDEIKGFVIIENGSIKQNSSLQPMSLDEYLLDFASKRPYLVNGDVKSGTGATENSKGGTAALVRSKADLRTAKEKSDFITKFGLEKFEALPLK